ncbi:MAG: lipoprotein-releasing ABC transporter ATP-binding protein LolD [Chromatiales bacterium]|jgi:lipoprotein-releasing system ATP-binding protein
MSNDIILECRGLSREFSNGPQRVEVLRQIDFAVARGDTTAIVGASGSGKSTLLQCLGTLDDINSGKVLLQGQDITRLSHTKRAQLRNLYLGFVYQFHHLLPEFTALENVAMPLLIRGVRPHDAKQEAAQMLEHVGLAHRVQHKPAELSGGERQRAAIARALVTRPSCVLADEPTGNLDSKTASEIFSLMLQLNREQGTSLVIVTHDTSIAAQMQRVFHLQDGVLQDRSDA